MAQKSENFKFEGKYAEYIPGDSTAIAAGDAVRVLNGRLYVATATKATQKNFVGICDDAWSSVIAIQKYGASSADYATPTTRPVTLKVYHEGVFDLAIRETSGTAGQAVYLITATTGAQVFTVDPISAAAETVMGPVGQLYETFSGATANDCQKVRITAGLQNFPRDIRWVLMNRLIDWSTVPAGTASIRHIGGCAAGDTCFATWGRVIAMVNGAMVGIESDCELGHTTCVVPVGDVGSGVIIWAFDSAGCVLRFYDSAKVTAAVASATLRADQFYWPSVTTDYLPFALGIYGGSSLYISGKITAVFRTYADCLRVT